tara:strand:- start:12611 stop:12796 length:186 start_codon:yes stop_codon:yes gene_type:complete
MKEEKNSPVSLRLRLSIELEKSKTTLLELFDSEFKSEQCAFTGKIVDGHVVIGIPAKESHF